MLSNAPALPRPLAVRFLRATTLTVMAVAWWLASPAQAQDSATQTVPAAGAPVADTRPKSDMSSKYLTGDWGGLRSTLADKGLTFDSGYISEVATNVSGGQRKAVTEAGQINLDTTLDTGKAFGWDGGTFHSSISYRRGYNLKAKAGLGTVLQPQEIYGRNQTLRLAELWFRQRTGMFDIKLGRLPLGNDFAAQNCDFLQLTFCGDQQGNLVGDEWYNYPISQWGAVLKVKPRNWYAQVGVYEYNPNNLLSGLAISHHGAQGVTAPAELGWTPHFGPNRLPGLYRIGGWYSTATAPDLLTDIHGRPYGLSGLSPAQRNGRYGGYVLLQQQVSGTYTEDADGIHATHGLTININFTQTDRATSRTDSQLALWLTFMGPFAARPQDTLGLGIGRNSVNGRWGTAAVIAAPGSEKPGAEIPIEMAYTVRPKPWLTIVPDVQYYIHPGGYSRPTDLVVLAARTTVAF